MKNPLKLTVQKAVVLSCARFIENCRNGYVLYIYISIQHYQIYLLDLG